MLVNDMETTIKVSVCVPVYGVEKYIEKCVRSLMEQTMKDSIEFVFVNDCTRDKSIEILKKIVSEYPERSNQVRIVNHNKNMGLPSARNTALHNVSGEYIIHCDSDDWMEPEMCQLMYKCAIETDADIVGCGFYENRLHKETIVLDDFDCSNKEGIKRFLCMNQMHFNVWQRLVKRTLYTKNEILFDPRFSMGEDCYANFMLHLKATKLATVKMPLYHYRLTNQNSLVKSSGKKGEKDISIMLNLIEAELNKNGLMEEFNNEFQTFCYLHKFWQTFFYSDNFDFLWYENYRGSLNKKFPKLLLPSKVKRLGYIAYLTSPKLLKLLVVASRKLHVF